jgi:hypothetical protein
MRSEIEEYVKFVCLQHWLGDRAREFVITQYDLIFVHFNLYVQ